MKVSTETEKERVFAHHPVLRSHWGHCPDSLRSPKDTCHKCHCIASIQNSISTDCDNILDVLLQESHVGCWIKGLWRLHGVSGPLCSEHPGSTQQSIQGKSHHMYNPGKNRMYNPFIKRMTGAYSQPRVYI